MHLSKARHSLKKSSALLGGHVLDLNYEGEIQDLLNSASFPQPPKVTVAEGFAAVVSVSILTSLASDLNNDSKIGAKVVEQLAKLWATGALKNRDKANQTAGKVPDTC